MTKVFVSASKQPNVTENILLVDLHDRLMQFQWEKFLISFNHTKTDKSVDKTTEK